MAEWKDGYKDARWQRKKNEVYEAANWTCELSLPFIPSGAFPGVLSGNLADRRYWRGGVAWIRYAVARR